ncbi:MAG: hypothetical protein AAF582_07510 [Pseudomonadota bacterium]
MPAYAQDTEPAAPERLTWEEISWENTPSDLSGYPFEARIKACVEDHHADEAYALATHCRAIPYEYLPEYTGMYDLDFPEWFGAQIQQSYVISFWRRIIDESNGSMTDFLILKYDRPEADSRATALKDATALFDEWVNVKCGLEQGVFNAVASNWRFVYHLNCSEEEISIRALELMKMRRIYVP